MVTGERIGPIGEVAPYISWAYREVEKATGVTFGKPFLEGVLKEGTTIFNSIPLANALTVFKSYHADQSVQFASALQKAVYYDGLAPEDIAAYGPLAEEFGIDGHTFTQQMEEEKFVTRTRQEFRRVQELGVQGFPTMVAEVDSAHYPLVRGYASLSTLENQLSAISQEI
ncbi:MAG: DsbA family protein, partial [Tunicatimonas sp.]|uniref:DsbA family protein n=1 Tax=Tunicatimonas sp. TaxID=1940096 RepID=UPI003C75E163